MYPMLICLSWLDISRFSHSLFPLYHISQLKSRCMITLSLQRWQLINLLYKSVHQVDFLHSWIIAQFDRFNWVYWCQTIFLCVCHKIGTNQFISPLVSTYSLGKQYYLKSVNCLVIILVIYWNLVGL